MMISIPPMRRRTGSSRGRHHDALVNRYVPMIVGILTIIVLVIVMIVAWRLSGSRWSVGPVVVVAPFLLAPGWPTLAYLHMPWLTQAVLTLGGTLTPLGVACWKNLDIAVPLMGITLAALVVATILDVPAPRDHPVGHTNEYWSSTALSVALASSVTCFLIVTSDSMWISLAVHEHWSGIVPTAALVVVIDTAPARFGRSAKAGAVFTMIAGLVAGLVVTSIAWFLGQTSDLLLAVFPFIVKRSGELAAFLTLGDVTGFGAGFAVSVVDALLGEHASPAELANILDRGTTKFLAVTLPVYVMIRIDGI